MVGEGLARQVSGVGGLYRLSGARYPPRRHPLNPDGESPTDVSVDTRGCSGCSLFWVLLGLFTLIPLSEVALLLRIKDAVGFGPTVALVFLTGVIGAALARWQGILTLRRIQTELAAGKLPAQALFDGALIVLAGAVLLTPGIMTDCVGFSLLIPQVRRFFGRVARGWAGKRFQIYGADGAGQQGDFIDAEVVASRPVEPAPAPGLATDAPGEVIDVEVMPPREDDPTDP